MAADAPTGGLSTLVSAIVSNLISKRDAAVTTLAGLTGYAAAAIPDAVLNTFPEQDPSSMGTYGMVGAVTVTALAQNLAPRPRRRRMLRRIQSNPQELVDFLLRADRPDLANELINVLEARSLNLMSRGQAARRVGEILNDLNERPSSPGGT